RHDPLDAAERGPDERPFHVSGQSADGARVPAVGAAVDVDRRLFGVVGMVDIAAAVGGQRQLLAERRQEPAIPARAEEGALRILTLVADDRRAVAFELSLAAGDILEPESRVDRGQGDRDLLL